jgi:hypothetical protein
LAVRTNVVFVNTTVIRRSRSGRYTELLSR